MQDSEELEAIFFKAQIYIYKAQETVSQFRTFSPAC